MNHGMLSLIFSAILAAIALAAPLTPLDADSATKSSEPVQKAILSEWLGAFVSVAPSGDVTADAHYGSKESYLRLDYIDADKVRIRCADMLPDCYMIQDGDQIRGGVPDSNGNEVFQIVEIDVTAVSLKGMNYTPETEGSTGEPTTECYVGFSQSDALAGCYDTQSVETRLSIIDASL